MSARVTAMAAATQQPRSYSEIAATYNAEYAGTPPKGGEPGNTGLSKRELVAAAVRTAKTYKPSDHLKDG